MSESIPERLNRAHDLIEEAVSILGSAAADLGGVLVPDLNRAVAHGNNAIRSIRVRLGRLRQEDDHAPVL